MVAEWEGGSTLPAMPDSATTSPLSLHPSVHAAQDSVVDALIQGLHEALRGGLAADTPALLATLRHVEGPGQWWVVERGYHARHGEELAAHLAEVPPSELEEVLGVLGARGIHPDLHGQHLGDYMQSYVDRNFGRQVLRRQLLESLQEDNTVQQALAKPDLAESKALRTLCSRLMTDPDKTVSPDEWSLAFRRLVGTDHHTRAPATTPVDSRLPPSEASGLDLFSRALAMESQMASAGAERPPSPLPDGRSTPRSAQGRAFRAPLIPFQQRAGSAGAPPASLPSGGAAGALPAAADEGGTEEGDALLGLLSSLDSQIDEARVPLAAMSLQGHADSVQALLAELSALRAAQASHAQQQLSKDHDLQEALRNEDVANNRLREAHAALESMHAEVTSLEDMVSEKSIALGRLEKEVDGHLQRGSDREDREEALKVHVRMAEERAREALAEAGELSATLTRREQAFDAEVARRSDEAAQAALLGALGDCEEHARGVLQESLASLLLLHCREGAQRVAVVSAYATIKEKEGERDAAAESAEAAVAEVRQEAAASLASAESRAAALQQAVSAAERSGEAKVQAALQAAEAEAGAQLRESERQREATLQEAEAREQALRVGAEEQRVAALQSAEAREQAIRLEADARHQAALQEAEASVAEAEARALQAQAELRRALEGSAAEAAARAEGEAQQLRAQLREAELQGARAATQAQALQDTMELRITQAEDGAKGAVAEAQAEAGRKAADAVHAAELRASAAAQEVVQAEVRAAEAGQAAQHRAEKAEQRLAALEEAAAQQSRMAAAQEAQRKQAEQDRAESLVEAEREAVAREQGLAAKVGEAERRLAEREASHAREVERLQGEGRAAAVRHEQELQSGRQEKQHLADEAEALHAALRATEGDKDARISQLMESEAGVRGALKDTQAKLHDAQLRASQQKQEAQAEKHKADMLEQASEQAAEGHKRRAEEMRAAEERRTQEMQGEVEKARDAAAEERQEHLRERARVERECERWRRAAEVESQKGMSENERAVLLAQIRELEKKAEDALDEALLAERDSEIARLQALVEKQSAELAMLRQQLREVHGSAHLQRSLQDVQRQQEHDRDVIEKQEVRGAKYLERYWRRIETPFGAEGSLQIKVKGPSKQDPEPAVVISEVVRDGPAHGAGLQAGDLVVKVRNPIGTWPIVTRGDFLNAIGPRGHAFEGVELSLFVVQDEKFIVEWRKKLLEHVKTEDRMRQQGSWYGKLKTKTAQDRPRRGSWISGIKLKLQPGAHMVKEVRVRMDTMSEEAKRSRLKLLREAGTARFGPQFSSENVFAMQSSPEMWRTLVLAACDQCNVAGSREMVPNTLAVPIVAKLAERLGSPAPPPQVTNEAFTLVDVEDRGGVDFNELTTFCRELFMDVVFREAFIESDTEQR